MGLKDFLFGTPGRIENVPTLTGGQGDLLSQLLGGLGGEGGGLEMGLQNIMGLLSGDPGALEAFQAPAIRQFEEQTVPGLAERFSGLGSGAQQSSAFGQALSSAGAGLSENLSAQRAGLQQNALSQLQSLLGLGLGTQAFQPTQIAGTEGFAQGALKGLGSLAGGIGSSVLGAGTMGALTPGVRGFSGGLRKLLGG